MSAVLDASPRLAAMTAADLEAVSGIEASAYSHPWTRGNFADSIAAGCLCRTWRRPDALIGYFVLQAAADEAHLLNLTVAPAEQRRGHGTRLLAEVLRLARGMPAGMLYLEVRSSNPGAQRLYGRHGFAAIGLRRGYYPAAGGRENAIVMARRLA